MVQVMQVMQKVWLVHVVRMISLDNMHLVNIWFKRSVNGKWKTGDPGVPGGSGGPGGPSSPGCKSYQSAPGD